MMKEPQRLCLQRWRKVAYKIEEGENNGDQYVLLRKTQTRKCGLH
jgi:hypothetical protein